MNRYEKIASVLEAENLDAVLLTGAFCYGRNLVVRVAKITC